MRLTASARTVAVACALALALAALSAPGPALGQGGSVPVEVAEVRRDRVTIEATAVGTLLSDESIIVRPEIAGRIVEIGFEEGTRVEKGTPLFKLDDSIYRAELADTRARLELAERNFERAKELYDRGAGTARALDQTQSELRTAEAAVELALARLTKTTIEAPFEGIAGLRLVSVGDYVREGQDLVNLEAIDPLKVDFAIPERYLGALAEGQTVRLVADAFPDRTFTGEVYAINPRIDPAGRSIQVRALTDNADLVLRPGLFVRVKLELERRDNALLIPEQAIVPRGQERYVFKVVDGKAVQTRVEIGQRTVGQVEIVSGLEPGDRVITAGHLKIGDGVPVQAVGAATDGAPGQGS